MLLKQIHYFVTIVDCNSFTEAAEQCYISQSAISQQINNLENDLSVKLIERGNRKFSLTPAGEYFYKYGKELLHAAERLQDETKRIASDDEVRLRIGYLNGYEGRELLDTVQKFAMLYPEVLLNVARYSHEDLYTLYNSDAIDMALSYQRRAFSDQNMNYHLKYAGYVIEVPSRGEPGHISPACVRAWGSVQSGDQKDSAGVSGRDADSAGLLRILEKEQEQLLYRGICRHAPRLL